MNTQRRELGDLVRAARVDLTRRRADRPERRDAGPRPAAVEHDDEQAESIMVRADRQGRSPSGPPVSAGPLPPRSVRSRGTR